MVLVIRNRLRWAIVCSHALLAVAFLIAAAGQSDSAEKAEAKPDDPVPCPTWIEGKVTAIVDGDTLHLSAREADYLIDLAGIDAPEKGQPSGAMAAQTLYLKVQGKQVRVLVLPTPTPNPIVRPITPTPAPSSTSARSRSRAGLRHHVFGILYCDGCVNSDLVREGLAWHDAKACPSAALDQAQASARKGRRGLWQSEQEPVPPWQWRQQREPQPLGKQDDQVPDLSRLFEAQTPAAAIEAAAHVQPAPLPAETAQPPAASPAGDYWLTASSGIRHNSKCRYYRKSKGRPCSAAEGRPCQKCGG